MPKQQGFSLAELLIIVAIILVIAAIALPNLLRSRIAANESAAISSVSVIYKAEVAYQTAYPTIGYASALNTLGPGDPGSECGRTSSTYACLIESDLAHANSAAQATNGYWFSVAPTGKDSRSIVVGYVAGAAAAVFNQTGVRDFCSIEDDIIHFQVPQGQSAPVGSGPGCTAMSVLQ